jgi:hypothetical protein
MEATDLAIISLLGSKNPIDEYYNGLPCMLGEVVGKIVGESGEGSWGQINGSEMYSIPLFATPHGTIIKTGVAKLSKITDEGLAKLLEHEQEVMISGKQLYDGKITAFKKCTVKRTIKVGEKIPNEISFHYDGGGGWTNLGSWYIDMLFKHELAKLQTEQYEFSEICRNENEAKAFYSALDINFKKMNFIVEFID